MWESFPVQMRGGLVTNTPSVQQGISLPGTARQLINFEPMTTSGYRRIKGFDKFSSDPIYGPSIRPAGVGFWGDRIIVFKNGSVIPYNSDGTAYSTNYGVYSPINNGKIKFIDVDISLSSGSDLTPASIFFGTETYTTIVYTTTTDPASFSSNINVLSASFGNRSHVTQFKGHLFLASGSDLDFTSPYDYTLEPANGAGVFTFSDDITGLHVFRETLIIFTQNSIHALSGNSVGDFNLQEVTNRIGCIDGDTIQEVSGDVLFLARDGVRKLGSAGQIGGFSNFSVSKSVQENMTNFIETNDSFCSCVVRNKSQYRLFGYKQTRSKSDSQGWIGTQQEDGTFHWSETRGLKVYSCASKVLSDGTEKIVFTNDDDYIYEMEVGNTFDGANISASFFTPYFSINDPTIRKTIYKANVFMNYEEEFSGTLQLSFDHRKNNKIQPSSITLSTTDIGSGIFGSAIFGEDVYSTSAEYNVEVQTVGTGFDVSLEFTFENSVEPFILDTIVLEYFTEGRK